MDRFPLPRVAALLLPVLLAACAGNATRDTPPAAQAAAPTSPASVAGDTSATAIDTTQVPDTGMAPAATAANPDAQNPDAQADAGDVASGAPQDVPTQAEQDYDAIYGAAQPYNPVADPTLPPAAQMPSSYDPWEKLNRKVFRFNDAVDKYIATPLARAYVKVVPRPVRLGIGNFFNNLGQPVTMVNALLQGQPRAAGASFGRFVVNSTIGVAGLFDPASRMHIGNRSEDFGQTLGVWGWKRSRYVVLPLFGPRTVRDTFGLVGDAPLAPLRYVEEDKVRIPLQGLQLVDVRTQLFAVDGMRQGAPDPYALVRDAWLQRRAYQISGDRKRKDSDATLPPYLQEDQGNPTTPVDVMPYVPEVPVR